MSKDISLFSGYSQKENRTTNYCMLIMKMLYEENPKFLSGVLSAIAEESVGDRVGVKFRQQESRAASVPDGVITQESITIYIETKNFDWFTDPQLTRHLEDLDRRAPGTRVLLALSNFESEETSRFASIRDWCATHYSDRVLFFATTFEEFLLSMEVLVLPKNLADAVADLRLYLDEEELLPSWQKRLDVVNCAGWPAEFVEGNVYMCPATGGAYSHRRSRFLGMYRNKRVEKIAAVEAVVDLEDAQADTILWKNVPRPDIELIAAARSKQEEWRPDRYPVRVFVLEPAVETHLVKKSRGGMIGSKQYFDIGSFGASNANELAEKLRGVTWEKLQELSNL